MMWRQLDDVGFRLVIRDRITAELWPIIPLDTRTYTEMTIVEEYTIPPHPEEVYFRALEEAVANLPEVHGEAAARIKAEINGMFARHLRWMGLNRGAKRWLLRRKDQLQQSTKALWINSWSGRRDGIRPSINPDEGIDP
ncbi:hypothetical protein ACHAQI_011818 [Fusarium lateritium]